jgi:hypothetical protein
MIDRTELQQLFDECDRQADELDKWEAQQMKRRAAPRMLYREQPDAHVVEPEEVPVFTQAQNDALGFALCELRLQWRAEMQAAIAEIEAKHGAELALLRRELEFVKGVAIELRKSAA